MKSKKPPNPTNQDKAWQKKIEKRVKVEKVALDQPKGKEQFVQVIKRIGKKQR